MTKVKKFILVTGGAGFIGSHLCERLVRDGHRVISLDNYFTGSKENHVKGVEYREGHTKDIEKHVPETPDVIYHLGEYSRVHKSLDEPGLVWDLNTLGTLGVLEFWRRRGSRLIYAGSSTKFNQPREDGTEGRDLAPYTWAKAANSELVHNYGRWYDLQYSIIYFYNVYGPGERAGADQYGTVIETFKQQYLKGQPLTIRQPGSQVRMFTHVDDTVEGIMLVAENGEKKEYGISAAEGYSLIQVAKMFGGEGVKLSWLPPTKSTRSFTATGGIDELKKLGWEQKKNLKDYIEEVKKQ